MISLDEALMKIDEVVHPLPPRRVKPLDAVGCALAEDIISDTDIPNFASSAMDGIAVRYADLNGAFPLALKLQGAIAAGKPARETLKPGYAYRIMTGAALPEGADTIIKVEDLRFEGQEVIVSSLPPRGHYVRPSGNDIRKGETVFQRGTVFKSVDPGICATLGLVEVLVHPKPSLTVLATGSEIQPPGKPLQPGQIYNANDTTLRAQIKHMGLPDPGAETPLQDDPERLTPVLKELCGKHDVVITSGAVSMGEYDYIPDIVTALGGDLLFHKVFAKPGKPVLIARLDRCWLLSLPGNPVSVLATFHIYGKRLLSRLMGQAYQPIREKAVTTAPFTIEGERFQVWGARLQRTDTGLEAAPAQNYTSGRLSSIQGIDGFIFISGGSRTVEPGTVVEVEWL